MTRINKIWTTVLFTLTSLMLFAPAAFAAELATNDADASVKKYIALAIGFGLAIAASMGASAQGKAAAAAFEGISRNPSVQDKLFTALILALALIESLVIYSLVISFLLLGKLG